MRVPGSRRRSASEAGALLEECLAHRRRSVGTRRTSSTEAGGERDLADTVAAEHALHALFGNQRLHRAGEREAEDEAPADLPRHPEREHQGFADFREEHEFVSTSSSWRAGRDRSLAP
jgi:hypothetical protein